MSLFELTIDGEEYKLESVDYGILVNAETEMRKSELLPSEIGDLVKPFAEISPDLAKKIVDEQLERRRKIPMQEVVEWAMDSVQGFVFTLVEQFRVTYPEKFEEDPNFGSKIRKSMFDLATKDQEEFQKIKDDRNITSELAEPVNPTEPPKSENEGGEKSEQKPQAKMAE